jgi:hypothetical protein
MPKECLVGWARTALDGCLIPLRVMLDIPVIFKPQKTANYA